MHASQVQAKIQSQTGQVLITEEQKAFRWIEQDGGDMFLQALGCLSGEDINLVETLLQNNEAYNENSEELQIFLASLCSAVDKVTTEQSITLPCDKLVLCRVWFKKIVDFEQDITLTKEEKAVFKWLQDSELIDKASDYLFCAKERAAIRSFLSRPVNCVNDPDGGRKDIKDGVALIAKAAKVMQLPMPDEKVLCSAWFKNALRVELDWNPIHGMLAANRASSVSSTNRYCEFFKETIG